MAGAKVSINGTTIMDISDTTATAEDVGGDKVFYNAAGVRTVGTGSGYVLKSGDTMTGNLAIKYTDKDFTTAPSTGWSSDSLSISDANNVVCNIFRTGQDENNVISSSIGARRAISGTTYFNFLTFKIASDGTRTIEISEREPWINALTYNSASTWRTALGLGTAATEASTSFAAASHNHDSTYLKLSGGTLTGSLTGTYITSQHYYQTHSDTDEYLLNARNADGTTHRGMLCIDTNNRFYLRSYVSTNTSSNNGKYEVYQLPYPATSITANATYDILTTKAAVTVAQGGTGATTFTSGAALIGNGTGAITTRSILNNTSTTYVGTGTDLITKNTLAYWNGAYNSSGSSNIAHVGTITSGTWNGTAIAAAYIGAHTNATAANIGQATASLFGHVKLSDNYTSSAGAASAGIAASSKAVYDAYTESLKVDVSGTFNTTAANITLPGLSTTWLVITGHNSTASLNTIWIVRVAASGGTSNVFPIKASAEGGSAISGYTMCGTVGMKVTTGSAGATLTGITGGGGINVRCIKIL